MPLPKKSKKSVIVEPVVQPVEHVERVQEEVVQHVEPVVQEEVVERVERVPEEKKKRAAPKKKATSRKSPASTEATSPTYDIKDANLEDAKSETLILHLPIKSSDVNQSNHPSAYNYSKQPIATYSIDGTVSCGEEEDQHETAPSSSYDDILKSTVIEKKDYTIRFDEDEGCAVDVNDEFDKKVKEFKEFKLTNYITQIPNPKKKAAGVVAATYPSHREDHIGVGTSLKELDETYTINTAKANPFMESSHIEGDIIQEHTNKMNKKNLKNIMVEFMNANMYQEWPDQTNIHCWWCCHPFEGPPCCLPEYLRRDKFYVSGCFCTFNCAASYNFSKNDHLVWERYTLLNLMYKKLYGTHFVKIDMAPPRESLKMFGGYLTIEEFRDHCMKQDRGFQVVKPPLISIIPKIEENLNPKNRSVNENILNSTQTKLKLTRTKPLIAEKSTIQTFMNITVKHDSDE